MKNKKLILIIISMILLFAISYVILQYADLSEFNKNSVSSLSTPTDVASDTNNDSEIIEEDTNNEEENERLKALDFTFMTYDGREVAISDYEGTNVVLNFFATWCGPCLAEMPTFSEAQERYKDKNVTFLMVNVQYPGGDTMDDLKNFVETTDYNFENILIDEDAEYFSSYGLNSFPTTLFIDTENYIQGAYLYPLEAEGMDIFINDFFNID